MKKIIIASHNPVKICSALNGFNKMFPGESFTTLSVSVDSGVGNQPLSNLETHQGAYNRASYARKAIPDGHFWVGIEGGVQENSGEFEVFAWVVILSKNQSGKSRTGTFFLPESLARLIREGKELGEADDIIFSRKNSKQGNGAIGLLSGDVIDRLEYYEHAVILALIPFKNPELYFEAP